MATKSIGDAFTQLASDKPITRDVIRDTIQESLTEEIEALIGRSDMRRIMENPGIYGLGLLLTIAGFIYTKLPRGYRPWMVPVFAGILIFSSTISRVVFPLLFTMPSGIRLVLTSYMSSYVEHSGMDPIIKMVLSSLLRAIGAGVNDALYKQNIYGDDAKELQRRAFGTVVAPVATPPPAPAAPAAPAPKKRVYSKKKMGTLHKAKPKHNP